jgi:hypothetical protein
VAAARAVPREWNPVRRSSTYADVVVGCGRPALADGRHDVLLNPTLAMGASEVPDLDSIGCTLGSSDVNEDAFVPVDRADAIPEEDYG